MKNPNTVTAQLYARNVELAEELDDLREELAKVQLRHKQIYAKLRKEVTEAAVTMEKSAKVLRNLVKENV